MEELNDYELKVLNLEKETIDFINKLTYNTVSLRNIFKIYQKAIKELLYNIDIKFLSKKIYGLEEYKSILIAKVLKTKKRWIKNDSSLIIADIEYLKTSSDKMQKYRYVDSTEEKLKEELESWIMTEDYLCNYKYFPSKPTLSKNKSMLVDIQLYLLNKLIETNDLTDKTEIIMAEPIKINNDVNMSAVPNELLSYPINTGRREKLVENEHDCNEYISIYKSTNRITTFTISKSIVDNDRVLEQFGNAAVEAAKSKMDSTDMKLIGYILENRGANFFQTGRVVLPFDQMCKDIFGYVNQRVRDTIKASILKMSSMVIKVVDTENQNIQLTTSILHMEHAFMYIEGVLSVKLFVSDTYRGHLISNNITKVYRNILEKCNGNSDAYWELFHLQRERLDLYFAYKNGTTLNNIRVEKMRNKITFVKQVHYTFFENSIVFNNKKKSKIKERIDKFLDIIVNTESILEDFIRQGDYYILKFKNVEEEEITDLKSRFIGKEEEMLFIQ